MRMILRASLSKLMGLSSSTLLLVVSSLAVFGRGKRMGFFFSEECPSKQITGIKD